jgi:hypothetical protein
MCRMLVLLAVPTYMSTSHANRLDEQERMHIHQTHHRVSQRVVCFAP